MLFPNFDAFAFSRLSQRERMVQQLQGRGLGSYGLAQMVAPHLGVVVSTRGISGFGLVNASAPLRQETINTATPLRQEAMSILTPLTRAPAPDPSDPCGGVVCPPQSYCSDGACVPNRAVEETQVQQFRPTTRMPLPNTATQETPPDMSTPDPGIQYANGTPVDRGSVQEFPRHEDTYAPPEDAPHGEPMYAHDDGGSSGGGSGGGSQLSPPAVAVPESMPLMVAPSGIPWWGFALGAAAAGFALYKLGGKKR